MANLYLFTDGSVNNHSGIGFGAFLFLNDIENSLQEFKDKVQLKRFENTSSTKIELQILLHALKKLEGSFEKIVVYSDSQNIFSLIARRQRLEQNNFCSKANRRIGNADLYIEFFSIADKWNIEFIKVKGHKSSKDKNNIERIFTLVDRASRRALRNSNQTG